jgi:PAS domain-containing protein
MKTAPRQTKPPARRKAAELRDFQGKQADRPLMRTLYRRAQAQLRKQRRNQKSKTGLPQSEPDTQRLVHELEVQQVELEMQNGELKEARNKLEVLLSDYTDLYDFAPVGYMSLNEQGQILKVNLTGAALLGMGRSRLINRPLS